MKLVGMFDSPYVRRVAISMRLLDVPFEHANWSIGADQARIAELNPLGQVPVLVLDDGEPLVDSAVILDYVDQVVGPARALVPATGDARRRVLGWTALAAGVADKARLQMYERVFRPAALQHEPLRLRLRAQMIATCQRLEDACAAREGAEWLVGDRITQADVTLGCALTYAMETVGLPANEHALPALRARHARLAELPVFREIYMRFDAPVIG
jgi:glutathione S-transferase